MKFTVSSTALLANLSILSHALSSKPSNQVLDNFLFKLEGEELTLTASDMETTLVAKMQVSNVEGNGLVALSAKILLDSLKEFPEMPLEFSINDSNLEMCINSQIGGVYKLIGIDGNEYPKISTFDSLKTIKLPADVVLNAINRTISAIGSDNLRPVMNGINFDMKPDGVTFVASDSQILIRIRSFVSKVDEPCSFILPRHPANLLKAALEKEDGDIEISLGDKNAYFKMQKYVMICRLIEGVYPNYNSVIPTNNPYTLQVDRVSFINTLKRVSVFTNQATHLINIELSENKITISAQDIDFSISAVESISCQYSGEQMTIGFKSDLVLQLLNNLTSQDVTIELSSPSLPGLFLPSEQDPDEHVTMLLMPMSTGI